jgi:hypothetical protein
MMSSQWGSRELDLDFLRSRHWWSQVDVREPGECWPWTRSTASHGYGNTWDGVTVRLAHRVAWSLRHEQQIPLGMTVDHWCRNRKCCNPAHLRLLTNSANASDNGYARITHCPQGHEYDEVNTYVDPGGGRRCRTCARTVHGRKAA